MNRFNIQFVKRSLSIWIVLIFILLSVYFFDLSKLLSMTKNLLSRPDLIFLLLFLYFLSFCLKAFAWKRYLQQRPKFMSCLVGILYSLFINHISPLKAGDLVRAGILSSREENVTLEEALHSVIVLRILDIISLFMFTLIGLLIMNVKFSVPMWTIAIAITGLGTLLILIKKKYSVLFARHFLLLKTALSGINGLIIFFLTVLSWVLEASVLFGVVLAIGMDLSFLHAIWINSLTVAGQVFQITPGGIANYETIMTFALSMLGFSMKTGYSIAIMTHGVKFIFSYFCGAFVLYYYPVSVSRIRNWIKQKGVLRA